MSRESEIAAFELGYKACERGDNIQQALSKFRKILGPNVCAGSDCGAISGQRHKKGCLLAGEMMI